MNILQEETGPLDGVLFGVYEGVDERRVDYRFEGCSISERGLVECTDLVVIAVVVVVIRVFIASEVREERK